MGATTPPRRERPLPYLTDSVGAQRSALWRRSGLITAAIVLIAVLAVYLRLVALTSDAYARLTWSSALLTDEGYYIHNARNMILFGVARTDGFNNMAVMPLLHLVQVAVFRCIGVGAVQARLISVFASLASLPLFYFALRRVFGRGTAIVGLAFLALDHLYVLYNRMALMDTPAAALMIFALYALTRSLAEPPPRDASAEEARELRAQNAALVWALGAGLLLGLAYATRTLSALAAPAFLAAYAVAALGRPRDSRWRPMIAVVTGMTISAAVYGVLWFAPHHAEIAAANGYYIRSLLLPRSAARLGRNIVVALFDYHRGTMPYIMRHSPVQCGLAIAAIFWAAATAAGGSSLRSLRGAITLRSDARAVIALLACWVAIYILFLACVNYAPSRYNVLFYPAMAALAAFALHEGPRIARDLFDRKPVLAVVGALLISLAGQALRFRIALISDNGMLAVFFGLTIALLIGMAMNGGRRPRDREWQHGTERPAELWMVGIAVWAVVNLYWTGDWLLHLTYKRKAADAWLAGHLPPNSTVIGDVAPGLCLDNRFRAINVIAGLANDTAVVEAFPRPRYIVILDGPAWRERWWDDNYPALVAPSGRIATFDDLPRKSMDVSVFAVDGPPGTTPPKLYLKR
ncbi:MAG TPA: glycosyltransferase family 39 protein [Chthonomonadaceae bacterium]|nr:glycosyltransferase family 39 protein [Chthonomonadaceae bacterium]